MSYARKCLLAAVTLGAIASAGLAATPAAAFDPVYNDGRRPYFGDDYGRFPYGNTGYGDRGYGYSRDWGSGYESGSVVIAVCPPGYRLGGSGNLCWPD